MAFWSHSKALLNNNVRRTSIMGFVSLFTPAATSLSDKMSYPMQS
jgi:hypothetical protein